MSLLRCPHCRGELLREGNSLLCPSRHRFDLASEGYVNLAVGKSASGDDPAMCRARRDFHRKDYYRPLAAAIAEAIAATAATVVCDAGCGEGYYLRVLRESCPDAALLGFDLAKTSIRLGAKAEKDKENPITYAVAGIFAMPLPDACCDAVLSVFAPVPDAEAHRILRDKGLLLVAHPGKDHLNGLKKHLYDTPYDNEEKRFFFDGFRLVGDRRVKTTVFIEKEDMLPLFSMTPYAYKTSREDIAKLNTLNGFPTDLDFILSIYEKQ